MRRAFTLTELLIVIAIIVALAGVAIPVIGVVRKQAKEVGCRNNLKQLYVGITAYRTENNQAFPYGLRNLFSLNQALADESMKVALCPFDPSKGRDPSMGRNTGGWWGDLSFLHEEDADSGFASSYCFEASNQSINRDPITGSHPWKFADGTPWYEPGTRETWWQAKAYQLRRGNLDDSTPPLASPFPENRLPIIRCWHHHSWKQVTWTTGIQAASFPAKVLNLAWDGSQWFSRPYWERDVNPNLPTD